MNRPIYALTNDEAFRKVSAKNEKSIIEEINSGFSEYGPSVPQPSQGVACYELYHKSSRDEKYVMHVDNGIILKLVKYACAYVLVKDHDMFYGRLDQNGVIRLDVLSMIIDKEDNIDSLYRYFEDNIKKEF